MQHDQEAFLERLYRENFDKMELYAGAILYDRETAPVAVQDAFLLACQKMDELMKAPDAMVWLKNTVRHTVLHMNRRKSLEKKFMLSIEALPVELSSPASNENALLDQCRSLLPPEDFQLVVSVVVEGVPYKEKAEELGISIWYCYKKVSRILDKLQKELKDEI